MSNAATSLKTMDVVLQSLYHERHDVVIGRCNTWRKLVVKGKLAKGPVKISRVAQSPLRVIGCDRLLRLDSQ